ncbi:hypothetical protein C0Q70_07186 [Pomacea canaliculata]|uniref:Kynureninase n=1 Tax=Pomacea canaliculata TaxID=400727 RepID=A0A2T7PED4_POMCA|nr:kynureninase-like [Pomacea canaliculata]PVD31768.1 hypothetical protein C0Q70_07186 [Pomacea canaliculata]
MDENAVICNDHTIKSKDLNQSANHKSVFAADDSHPGDKLLCIATKLGLTVEDEAFAEYMDEQDPLRSLREEFFYPKMKDLVSTDLTIVDPEEDCVYFCGNSLGLCPRSTKKHMDGQIDKWAKLGVQGHVNGELPWAHCDECVDSDMAKLVGAKDGEVAVMNGLTVNLHLQLISFYRPTPSRHKILCESKAFPSDHYAFESQIRFHGYDPAQSLICMEPRKGECILRTEDIIRKIEEEGENIAVVCFSGIQYYTGQLFDIPTITSVGQKKGCYVGWDLAHAAGNVELFLHDWNVDFACWCSYKYINSSAGSLAGFFIHERHRHNDFPKLLGWWGHDMATRFNMDNEMVISPGAYGYRISNPPGFLVAPIKASLEVFAKTSMKDLVAKSRLLTGYLELLVNRKYKKPIASETITASGDSGCIYVEILTPSDPKQRGAQLSLAFSIDLHIVIAELSKRGVVCDKRLPRVIRVSPAPLYCSFKDVHRFMRYLADSLEAAAGSLQTLPNSNSH